MGSPNIVAGVIGQYTCDHNGDGSATSAHLQKPFYTFVTAAGVLYIADSGNNLIRKVMTPTVANIVCLLFTYQNLYICRWRPV